ncbi:MAG TPA: hypothetical protein VGK90_10905 [Rhizomicrobium sp.]|jgi:lipoprotein NlpI
MARFLSAAMLAMLLLSSARASSVDDFNQGIEAHNRGDNETAISVFSRALASGDLTKNQKRAALLDRGFAYKTKKRYVDAIADFTSVLAIDPSRIDATLERMQSYLGNEQDSLAASDCDTLIKMRPGFAAFYEECGIISWQDGNFPRAVSYFDTGVGLGLKPSIFGLLWWEIARMRAGMPQQAKFALLAKKLNLDGWPSPIFDLYLGKSTPDTVMAAAEKSDRPSSVPGFLHFQDYSPAPIARTTSQDLRRCQAAFFVGEWQLLNGNIAQALPLLNRTETYCKSWLPAKKEVARLAQK